MSRYAKVFIIAYAFVRSSRLEVFCEKGVLRNFAKFTGNHLRQTLFLNKVAGLRPQAVTQVSETLTFLRTPFHTEHLWWLLLFCVLYAKFMFKMLEFVFPFLAFYISLKQKTTDETRPLTWFQIKKHVLR